jgi:hypothetical protein
LRRLVPIDQCRRATKRETRFAKMSERVLAGAA